MTVVNATPFKPRDGISNKFNTNMTKIKAQVAQTLKI
jgi:hypothetical protein